MRRALATGVTVKATGGCCRAHGASVSVTTISHDHQLARSMKPRPESPDAELRERVRQDPANVAATRILDSLQAIYQPTHDYVPADPQAFRHLDLRWYDRTASTFEALGFRRFGDIEDRTITNAPNTVLRPTFMRTMVSRDGTVTSALYDPRIKGIGLRLLLWVFRKLPGKVVDFETECTDGSFVATSNATSAGTITLPPIFNVAWLPMTTEPREVYATHVSRLAEHLKARPGVTPVVIESPEAMMKSPDRQNALKAAFRGEIPGLTPAELDALSLFGKGHLPAVQAALESEHRRRAG